MGDTRLFPEVANEWPCQPSSVMDGPVVAQTVSPCTDLANGHVTHVLRTNDLDNTPVNMPGITDVKQSNIPQTQGVNYSNQGVHMAKQNSSSLQQFPTNLPWMGYADSGNHLEMNNYLNQGVNMAEQTSYSAQQFVKSLSRRGLFAVSNSYIISNNP